MAGMIRTKVFFLVPALLLVGMGCAPPFPKESLAKIDRGIVFKELRKNPEQYTGTWIMLAGVIVDVKNTNTGTFIEVLQQPMNDRGRPLETDATEGRFIIVSREFLDSAVYHRGRLLTVVGEVAGQKILPLGDIEYRYPLIKANNMHLWRPSSGPRVHFGIGVWHSF